MPDYNDYDLPYEALFALSPESMLADFGSRASLDGKREDISKAAGYFPGQGNNTSYDITQKKVTPVGKLAPTEIPSTGQGRQAGTGGLAPSEVQATARGWEAGARKLTPAKVLTTAKKGRKGRTGDEDVRKSIWGVDHGVAKAWKDQDEDTPAGKRAEKKAAKKRGLSYAEYEKKFKDEDDVKKSFEIAKGLEAIDGARRVKPTTRPGSMRRITKAPVKAGALSVRKNALGATVFPGYHGALRGKKGKQVKAAAKEVGATYAGNLVGMAAGAKAAKGKPGGMFAGGVAGGMGGAYGAYKHNKSKGYYRKGS